MSKPKTSIPDKPWTIKQAAEHFSVCTKTIRRIIKARNVPVIYVGGQVRIPVEHIPLLTKKKW